MNGQIFSGCIPALMTPCKADRSPDFVALVRKGKDLIAAGMSAVVYCGSMGDWPLLTDAQRQEGVAHLVAAGMPTIVGTGAVNSAAAVSHAARAQGRNVVLCPSSAYDRSPSGAGSSAKLACLAADGALAPGKDWGQETIIDSSYRLSYQPGADGKIIATIAGQAFVTSEPQLIFFAAGP